jgi:hypothetical protein
LTNSRADSSAPLMPMLIFLSLMSLLHEAFGCRLESRLPESPRREMNTALGFLPGGDDRLSPVHYRSGAGCAPLYSHSIAGT